MPARATSPARRCRGSPAAAPSTPTCSRRPPPDRVAEGRPGGRLRRRCGRGCPVAVLGSTTTGGHEADCARGPRGGRGARPPRARGAARGVADGLPPRPGAARCLPAPWGRGSREGLRGVVAYLGGAAAGLGRPRVAAAGRAPRRRRSCRALSRRRRPRRRSAALAHAGSRRSRRRSSPPSGKTASATLLTGSVDGDFGADSALSPAAGEGVRSCRAAAGNGSRSGRTTRRTSTRPTTQHPDSALGMAIVLRRRRSPPAPPPDAVVALGAADVTGSATRSARPAPPVDRAPQRWDGRRAHSCVVERTRRSGDPRLAAGLLADRATWVGPALPPVGRREERRSDDRRSSAGGAGPPAGRPSRSGLEALGAGLRAETPTGGPWPDDGAAWRGPWARGCRSNLAGRRERSPPAADGDAAPRTATAARPGLPHRRRGRRARDHAAVTGWAPPRRGPTAPRSVASSPCRAPSGGPQEYGQRSRTPSTASSCRRRPGPRADGAGDAVMRCRSLPAGVAPSQPSDASNDRGPARSSRTGAGKRCGHGLPVRPGSCRRAAPGRCRRDGTARRCGPAARPSPTTELWRYWAPAAPDAAGSRTTPGLGSPGHLGTWAAGPSRVRRLARDEPLLDWAWTESRGAGARNRGALLTRGTRAFESPRRSGPVTQSDDTSARHPVVIFGACSGG